MLRIWLEIGLGDLRSEDLQTPRAAIYSMWWVMPYAALQSLVGKLSHNWTIDVTWANVPILDSNKVDHLVSLCDSAEHVRSSSVQWAIESNIPFGVFPSYPVPYSLDYGEPLKDEEAFLFKHYVDHVALIMMPYDDQRNPWRSSYPAEALYSNSQEQKALFYAMIAQSALNLAHLGCSRENLMLQAARYYSLAIKELRTCMEGSPGGYASFIAAISTLMFVEVCTQLCNNTLMEAEASPDI
jgi:hypothetical protein